jgi:transposase InsO family protein
MICHPLTMIDDHSRFVPCLAACADQKGLTVRSHLERTFRHYGLPDALFVDNGAPWGEPSGERWTRLGVWLLKLGVAVLHSRPYHPQSRGKNERFHRTLKAEVFAFNRLAISQPPSAPSMIGANVIISSDRMARSITTYRPAATVPARAPCLPVCRR